MVALGDTEGSLKDSCAPEFRASATALTRVVVPAMRSRRNTSLRPLLSPLTRLPASELKITLEPLRDRIGLPLPASGKPPDTETTASEGCWILGGGKTTPAGQARVQRRTMGWPPTPRLSWQSSIALTATDCGTQFGRLITPGEGEALAITLMAGLKLVVGKAAPPPLMVQAVSVVVATGPEPEPPPPLLTAIGAAVPVDV